MGGIHDIAADADGIWAAVADNDLIVRMSWDGRVEAWHWRTDRPARRALGLKPLPSFSRWADHRNPDNRGVRLDVGHVNAVAARGGDLIVGLGVLRPPRLAWPVAAISYGARTAERLGFGRVVAAAVEAAERSPRARGILGRPRIASARPGFNATLQPGQTQPAWSWAVLELPGAAARLASRRSVRVVARHSSGGRPAHNVVPWDDRIVANDSPRGDVVALDARTGAVVSSVHIPGELPFPRGLLHLDGGRFLVGIQQPARILVVDLDEQRIEREIALPGDRNESPYAISFVPDGFLDPRGRLPTTRAGWGITGADARADQRPTGAR
jgi:hypothetical protein